MKRSFILLLLVAGLLPIAAFSQSVDPKAYYTNKEGNAVESSNVQDGQAPLECTFRPNATEMDDCVPAYEWHFRKMDADGENFQEILVRYEEETQYTFVESGTFQIVLKTSYTRNNETFELDPKVVEVVIGDSFLEMPNAFSPNDDDYNKIYGAKGVCNPNSTSHYRNIVEFHGYIFNRWGQKLFEWTDISSGWDGTYNGRPVKEGVYFVLVKAKGADGREYNIRRDVNLLRGYNENAQSNNATEE